jgi:hypothetical protein
MTELRKSPVEIRLATVEDARGIAEAHVASWRATYPGIVPQHYIDSLKVEEFADPMVEPHSHVIGDGDLCS